MEKSESSKSFTSLISLACFGDGKYKILYSVADEYGVCVAVTLTVIYENIGRGFALPRKIMERINYGKILEKTLSDIKNLPAKPKLLLHACCAPCSSYVLEYLADFFEITLLYYNPNIEPEDEYVLRSRELLRLVKEMPGLNGVSVKVAPYTPGDFAETAKGREGLPEGGARCYECYRLRLEYTARLARDEKYDCFCTTLSISPHKSAAALNEIGAAVAEKYGVKYLLSDFKKKGGYLRSCRLSEEYGLYRQNYCGCKYSKAVKGDKKTDESI